MKETRKPKKKLTLKQQKFTKELLKSGNGTQAAIKAGYSERSARQIAAENMTKPVIQSTIQSAAEKLGINPEYVLGNLKEIADFNKTKQDKFDQFGNKKTEMTDTTAALKANELLGKHLSLFTDKSEIDVKVEDVDAKKSKIELAKQIILGLKNPDLLNS